MTHMSGSYRTLGKFVEQLRLKEGDILVVSDRILLENLQKVRVPGVNFTVPILFAPYPHSFAKASREQLVAMIEQIDRAAHAKEAPAGNTLPDDLA